MKLILLQNMEIECTMSTFSKTFATISFSPDFDSFH